MNPLRALLAAALCSSSAFANPQTRVGIPSETPTMERLENAASMPSPENLRRTYDGGAVPSLTAGSAKTTAAGANAPGATAGAPNKKNKGAVPGIKAATASAAPAPAKDGPPFWDQNTIGFAGLGLIFGMILGIGLIGPLGWAGVLVGGLAGAAGTVALWKGIGYTKK